MGTVLWARGVLVAWHLMHADPARAQSKAALAPVSSFDNIRIRDGARWPCFSEAGKVITHPRCLNCHPADNTPRQGEDMRVHAPPVQRGPTGTGSPPMRCFDLPRQGQLRCCWYPRPPTLASRTDRNGMGRPVAGCDLRADQGPPAQRRQNGAADRRPHGARLAGRLGLASGRPPRAGARHPGGVRSAHAGMGKDWAPIVRRAEAASRAWRPRCIVMRALRRRHRSARIDAVTA